MKSKRRKIKQIFLLVTLTIFFALFVIDAAAINTPFIEVPNEETEAKGETTTDSIEGTQSIGETEQPSETVSEQPTANQKQKAKKGCGSIIPQSGTEAILIFGVIEIFLMRKEKQNGTAD